MDHMSSLMLGLGFEGKGLKGFVSKRNVCRWQFYK